MTVGTSACGNNRHVSTSRAFLKTWNDAKILIEIIKCWLVRYGQLVIKLECLHCQKAWSHACMHKGVLSIRLIFQDRIYDPATDR